MIRVVLVDDQHLVRTGIRALLERTDDITVVGEADDGARGVDVVQRERPDVVLMDVRMPGIDGLDATRRITTDPALAGVGVIVLTTFDTDDHIHDAIALGASGFLLKDSEPDELRHAIRAVAAGDALLSPSVTRRVMTALAAHRPAVNARRWPLDRLTDREREVLVEVGHGRSNDEIAAQLHMSPATARTHVSRLLTKLHARDRSQLVIAAYETGLVTA
ncbi:MAG TPA: response regulator transcription factor [Ilumatobacter sp.]|nr:response regulator transcription factor [Ilumatobacter sp.]